MKAFKLAALLVIFFSPLSARAEERLTILHTSEHHGTLQPIESGPFKGMGGVARRAGLIEKIRKEVKNVLLVDSGDLVIGTAMSSAFHGAPDIAAMSLMRYDAQTLGNHDFDFGLRHLESLKRQARFPFLCTNLRPKRAGVCREFVVKTVGRLRIGLIGLVGRKIYPESLSPVTVKELEFEEPIGAAKKIAGTLRQRVDLIVAVTHEDTDEDLALAKSVAEIDVIVGGHTPGFDGLIPATGENPLQGRIDPLPHGPIFVKSHQQARTLGRLDLWYDKRLTAAEARNIPIDASLPDHPKVAVLVETYVRRLDSVTNRVLGQALVNLEGESSTVRARETNFGNLLTDLARAHIGTDIALVNGGLIRSSIPAGPVTLKRVLEVLPFDDSLVSFKLPGAQLVQAMENSVSRYPESGRFLQVSGMSYAFDPAVPVGSRITEVRVQGAPLERARDYSVVVNRFLADGGDGYAMFAKARDRVEQQILLRDLLAAALAAGSVTAKEEGRIKTVSSKE
jgi:5'-nucleotidase / UDP-sugar diphosphatase